MFLAHDAYLDTVTKTNYSCRVGVSFVMQFLAPRRGYYSGRRRGIFKMAQIKGARIAGVEMIAHQIPFDLTRCRRLAWRVDQHFAFLRRCKS